MKIKTRDSAVHIIAASVLAAFFIAVLVFAYKYFICYYAASNLESSLYYDCAKVLVYGSGDDSVSASITFTDSDSNIVAEFERSWNAPSVSVDFACVTFLGKKSYFPYRIYASDSPGVNSGVMLRKHLFSKGRFELLGSSWTDEQKKYAGMIADFALTPAFSIFSSHLSYYSVNLGGCIPGKEYRLFVGSRGPGISVY